MYCFSLISGARRSALAVTVVAAQAGCAAQVSDSEVDWESEAQPKQFCEQYPCKSPEQILFEAIALAAWGVSQAAGYIVERAEDGHQFVITVGGASYRVTKEFVERLTAKTMTKEKIKQLRFTARRALQAIVEKITGKATGCWSAKFTFGGIDLIVIAIVQSALKEACKEVFNAAGVDPGKACDDPKIVRRPWRNCAGKPLTVRGYLQQSGASKAIPIY